MNTEDHLMQWVYAMILIIVVTLIVDFTYQALFM